MCVKDLVFGKADERHVDAFLELIDERIEWMNAVGIDQWNNNHYHERYPKEYFLDVARSGKMYMLSDKDDGKMVAGAVLFEEDKRWGKMSSSAYYLHNLAASLRVKPIAWQGIFAIGLYLRQRSPQRMVRKHGLQICWQMHRRRIPRQPEGKETIISPTKPSFCQTTLPKVQDCLTILDYTVNSSWKSVYGILDCISCYRRRGCFH